MTRKTRHRIQQKSFKNLMFQTKIMREESFLTDFQLICDDKEFLVHKVILSAASPYFKEHFKRNSQTTSLQMDFINSKTLDTVLRYIYQGRIDLRNQSQPFLKDLLEAFIRLQIPLMYNYCLEHLLGTQQFLSQWNTIEQLNSELIKQIYLEYLHKNIKTLKTTESFLNLRFEQLNALLNCPVSNPVDQEELISSILLWVKHDESTRLNRITDLLATIDFEKLSKPSLTTLEKEDLLQDNLFFLKQLTKVLLKEREKNENSKDLNKGNNNNTEAKSIDTLTKSKSSLVKKTRNPNDFQIHQKLIRERNPKQTNDKGNDSIHSISDVENQRCSEIPKRILAYDYYNWCYLMEYKTDTNKWIQVKDEILLNLFSKLKCSSVCSFETSMYFLGGHAGEKTTDKCYKLDLIENKVIEINPMITCSCRATAVKLDQFIYVIGDHNNLWKYNASTSCYEPAYLNSCERYDLTTHFWEPIARIPFEYHRNPASVVAVDGRLCLIGKNNLIWFDPKLGEWSEGEVLPEDCKNSSSSSATVADRKIYLVFGTLTDILCFDPMNKSWERYSNNVVSDLKGIFTIQKPDRTEFLIFSGGKTFLYRPPNKWLYISTVPFISVGLFSIDGSC